MEDSRIRRALEAVAGLYLTGTGRDVGTGTASVARDNGTGEGKADPPADPFVDGPAAAETEADPAEPGEALGATAGPSATADPPATTDPSDSPTTGSEPTHRVEAVLLGHLPGYANPWISQYAHHLAERHGSAALLRIEGGTVRVERFDADDGEHRSLDEASAAPAENPPAAGLTEVLAELSPDVGACVVSLERRESGEPDRAKLAELPRWTLLSGADDAATVGGYRLLKGLLGVDGPGEPEEGIGVMFMGCDEDAAHGAMERLRQATEAHLGVSVEMAGLHPRIEAVRRCALGTFELDDAAWDRLRGWLEEFRRPEATEAGEPDPWLEASDIELSDEELAALHAPEVAEATDEPEAPAEPKSPAESESPAMDREPHTVRAHGNAPQDNGELHATGSSATTAGSAPKTSDAGSEVSETTAAEREANGPQITVTGQDAPQHRGRPQLDAAAHGAAERDADAAARSLHGEVIRMGGLGVDPEPESSSPAPAGNAVTETFSQSVATGGNPETAPAAEPADIGSPAGSDEAAATGTTDRTTATAEAEASAPAAETVDPARHLDGVEPIEAWCPRHPSVQLALDREGRLHLALFQSGADTLAGGARRLIEAARWAREHRGLIGLTLRNRELDPRAEPVLHLMTDEPRAAVDLSLMGLAEGHAIRLHLLKAVTVEGRTIHVHEPLN